MGKTLADGYLELRIDPSKLDNDTRRAFKELAFKERGRAAGKDAGDGLAKGFSDRAGVFGRVVATTAAKLTLVGGAAAAATPGVLHLTGALLPATGALVALPAAMGAVKLSMATLKIATDGVAGAIGAGLTGNAKQAQKAMEGLAPAAKAFALSVVALKPQIEGLKASVSGRLFAPIQSEVTSLAQVYFPVLRKGMGGLAGSFGGLGQQFAETAKKADVVKGVGDLFLGTRLAVDKLRGAVDPLTMAFAVLIQSTAPELPGIAQGFTDIATKIGAFVTNAVDSGRVLEVFENAKATLRDLGGIAVNVASILGSVFKAAAAGSGSLLGNLRELTGQVAAFLKSGQGSTALTGVFQALAALGAAMRTALGAALPAIAQSVQRLAPAVVALAAPFAQLVVAVAPLLPIVAGLAAQLLIKLTPAIAAFSGWLTRNLDVLKATAAAVGVVVVAVKAFELYTKAAAIATGIWTAVQQGAALAAKAWAGFQWLLNAALSANPIGLVVLAVGALVAAIVIAYKNSETFRSIVQGAWQGIQAAVSFAWNNVIKPAVNALVGFFRNVIAPTALWLWRNVFQPVFTGIGFVVKAAWVVIQIALKAFQLFLTNVIFPVVRFLYNNVVKPIFTAIGVVISAWWNGYAKPVFGLAKAGFSALGSGLSAVWNNVIKPVFHALGNFITGSVLPAFRRGVDLIRAAWSKVQDAAKLPVKFVVENVINPFVGGINEAAKVVGIKARITPIKLGFADGGQVPGYAAGGRIGGAPSAVDNRLAPATIPGVGAVKLAGGEFIVNARDTLKALPLLRWVNAGMKGGPGRIGRYLGKPLADMPGDGSEGWAFKDGGIVGWAKDVWGAITHPAETIKKPFEALLGKIPGAGMIKDFLVGSAKKVLNGAVSWLTGIGNGDGGGNVAKAMAFVRSQVGKPYVWASAGPGGYDCSGIVSAVYNVMKGTNPYSHTFTTDSLPGSWFTPNRVGPLMAGWSHPGQSPAGAVGHMAGQIGALPFESTGSTGVRIGGAARRITAFAHKGGARFARGGRVPLFDTGGTLMPGLNTVYNGLGRPEQLVRADSGNTYNINVTVAPGGHPAETGRQIIAAIQASEKINGTRWRQ